MFDLPKAWRVNFVNKKEACGGDDLDLSPQIMSPSFCISLSIATHRKYMRV